MAKTLEPSPVVDHWQHASALFHHALSSQGQLDSPDLLQALLAVAGLLYSGGHCICLGCARGVSASPHPCLYDIVFAMESPAIPGEPTRFLQQRDFSNFRRQMQLLSMA
jgi:hypothetical protein